MPAVLGDFGCLSPEVYVAKPRNLKFCDFAVAVAGGATTREWCEKNGIPFDTAKEWRKDPEFREIVASILRERLEAYVATLNAASIEMAEGMIDLARNGTPDSTKLAAQRAVISDQIAVIQAITQGAELDDLRAAVKRIEERGSDVLATEDQQAGHVKGPGGDEGDGRSLAGPDGPTAG